ncbi:MAG: deoxyribodipyrimidine photo-lyase, partial [Krumholzibacteria bacterium]|nr:deoxyribodipyrimidine photo-lyase [Candidatus Krumholzibacteria bacterium]
MAGGAAPVIVWYRLDLRLEDHPALAHAAAGGRPVIPVFIASDEDGPWAPGGAARWWLHHTLAALERDLAGLGLSLVLRRGAEQEVLGRLVAETGAATVCFNRRSDPPGRGRDLAIAAALAASGVQVLDFPASLLWEPDAVLNRQGGPYKVFTPFYRAWKDVGWPKPVARPRAIDWVDGVSSEDPPEAPDTDAVLPEPGEAAATRTLDNFLRSRVEDYHERRNEPGADATSRLSPYLKWGCIHPRQILGRLGRSKGEESFRSEIAWREFYADVLLDRPDTVRQAYQEKMRRMRLDTGATADDRFAAWAEGRTGYPLVDAGMRQLHREGWMHNRARLLTGSFLTKHLGVDWRRGAAHFLEWLVDGDIANNSANWQWVAGT